MKKTVLALGIAFMTSFTLYSCDNTGESSSDEIENTDVVESGTYSVTAERVDAEEKEIYVNTEDGKTLELYFTDNTQLTQNGQPAEFSALQEGQQLEVTVEKKGNRLEPMSVNIMQ